jgi:dihydroceramidase
MTADGATCLTTRCFCEAVRQTGLAQPANAWSSLAFVVVGVLVIATVRPAALLERRLVVSLGIALTAVGLGSFAFHATLSLWGQFVDVLPMYAVGCVLIAGGLLRLGWVGPRPAVLLGAALLVALGAVLWAWPESRRWVFAAVLLPGIVLEVVCARRAPGSSQPSRWLWIGLGVLSAAYVIWLLDQSGTLCDPTSPLQGHAAWHLLGAAAGWCLARHYAATSGPLRRLGA